MTLSTLLLAMALGILTKVQVDARGKDFLTWSIIVIVLVLLLPRVSLVW